MGETDVWIRMADGVRLAATLFLPEGERWPRPWPAVLEALPYRKDDLTASYVPEYRRLRDEGGYAVCRVDVRGTGSSEGLAVDEYPSQEQRDLSEVIAWLAGQDWSTGVVGMYGTSYSGFNAIQVAAERPPGLRAIIPIYATDDRYTDDVHYGGGTRRGLDVTDYPTYMVAMNALPPTPSVFGPGWREEWRRRVEALDPWVLRWLEEQVDGPYWRHGSLRPSYDRIACPTMIVAGWADGYRNATFRMFERLGVPKRLLIGPWSHTSAETSLPGPHIDLVREMIRWWDRWLRGADTGVDREPPIQVFVRRSTRPAPDLAEMRGEWRFEPSWPPERQAPRTLELSGALGPGKEVAVEDALDVRGDVGVEGSIWCAGYLPFGQPLDQRPDEAFSLAYEWPPLPDDLEILGYPRLEAVAGSSAPVAFLSAKVCDVFPDGTSALVCRGFLNLTHRDSHASPEPLRPGRMFRVGFDLDATSWVFEAGHRIRLDLAGTDWPNLWPPPGRVALTVERSGTRLILPVMEGPPPVADRPSFAPPPGDGSSQAGHARGAFHPVRPPHWRVERDVLEGETRVVVGLESEDVVERGTRVIERYGGEVGVAPAAPDVAWAKGSAFFSLAFPEASVTSEVRSTLRSDGATWHVVLELEVGDGGEARWTRRWERRFPRHLG